MKCKYEDYKFQDFVFIKKVLAQYCLNSVCTINKWISCTGNIDTCPIYIKKQKTEKLKVIKDI